ncbi:type VI secretion system ImpA family N-terminal domain-containing protein [Ascidiaceihabitans sp.]|uniref:type VI secretion system protein TssA n=1 Tax=Ascidiaceihabitans sp. TaxID=1872644 RepID=UPI003298C821
MSFEWLTQPIHPDEPCGLDLDLEGDDDYIDYLDDVDIRLPSIYAKKVFGGEKGETAQFEVFQPSSVKIKQERKAVEDLLQNTRDIRLLVYLAQWEILAGELEGFMEAVEAIAALIEAFGPDVHPALTADPNDRKLALEALTKSDTVLQPMQHVSLTGADDVTYRLYQVATQAVTARGGEESADAGRIMSDIGSASEVEETHAFLTRTAVALHKIMVLSKKAPEGAFTPKLEGLFRIIADIQGLIRSGRADLQVWSAEDAGDMDDSADDTIADEDAGAAGDDTAAGNAPTTTKATSVADAPAAGAITTQPEARVTLRAIETYLARFEPSSAALLLVTQSRLLIGRPLIEALETLLPGEANKAVIDFGPGTGFALNMDKLRTLASEGLSAVSTADDPSQPDPTPPVLNNRADVAAQLRAVEDFFRRNEPTSPVPLLLVRARVYLDKDFEAIVADLIPKQVSAGD